MRAAYATAWIGTAYHDLTFVNNWYPLAAPPAWPPEFDGPLPRRRLKRPPDVGSTTPQPHHPCATATAQGPRPDASHLVSDAKASAQHPATPDSCPCATPANPRRHRPPTNWGLASRGRSLQPGQNSCLPVIQFSGAGQTSPRTRRLTPEGLSMVRAT